MHNELKVKETNRIDTVVAELTKLGARIEATDDGNDHLREISSKRQYSK
ncbi:hypothetical protein ACT7CZ_17740 [Bacillus cereus]